MTERLRAAVVKTDKDADTIARYLPANYHVLGTTPDGDLVICGTDTAGWTLDGYIIPRLASGLHWATEITEGAITS